MTTNSLQFAIQKQQCDEWCWAAVVSSVAAFVQSTQQPQQCEIVDKEAFSPDLPSPGCCKQANSCRDGQSDRICNAKGNVGRALKDYNLTQNSAGQIPSAGTFAVIKQQIDSGCAVVVQVADRAHPSLAHVMVIVGYGGDDSVSVADPATGGPPVAYSYSALRQPLSGASGDSNWRLSKYFTTIPGAGGGESDGSN
jgi:Papain-like cysteine protease AvrRpt2